MRLHELPLPKNLFQLNNAKILGVLMKSPGEISPAAISNGEKIPSSNLITIF